MKMKYFPCMAALAAAALLGSCSDDKWNNDTDSNGKGRLNTAALLPEVVNEEIIVNDWRGSAKAHASRSTISLDNFLVTVADNKGNEVANWTFKDMPSLPTFNVGTYSVTVRSHQVQPAEWEAPYFVGSTQFQINDGEVTDVDKIKCVLSNIRVSVSFSDELAAVCGTDVNVKVTSTEGNSLDYSTSENRSGYFEAVDQMSTLEVHFTGTVAGNAENFKYVLRDVAAGQHRKVQFSLKQNPTLPPEEMGEISTDGEGISVSTSVVGVDLTSDNPIEETLLDSSDRPGKEDPENPEDPDPDDPEPQEPAATFASSTLDLEGVNDVADYEDGSRQAKVTITCPKGVAHLNVKIVSDGLTKEILEGVRLTDEFDLAEPGQYEEGLKSLGFPTGNEVIGSTEVVFDITQFVPLLTLYGSDHSFQLEVIDQQNGTASLDLRFHYDR